jgi:hypothetical protein
MGRTCSIYGGRRGAYRVLVEKPEGMRPFGKLRHRWEDNIKMDLQEVGYRQELDQAGSGQGQMAGSCEVGNEPSGSIRCRKFLNYLRTC